MLDSKTLINKNGHQTTKNIRVMSKKIIKQKDSPQKYHKSIFKTIK